MEKFVLRLADRVAAAVVIKECNYSLGGSRAETRSGCERYRKQMRVRRSTRLFAMAFPIRENIPSAYKGKKSEPPLYYSSHFFAAVAQSKSQRPVSLPWYCAAERRIPHSLTLSCASSTEGWRREWVKKTPFTNNKAAACAASKFHIKSPFRRWCAADKKLIFRPQHNTRACLSFLERFISHTQHAHMHAGGAPTHFIFLLLLLSVSLALDFPPVMHAATWSHSRKLF